MHLLLVSLEVIAAINVCWQYSFGQGIAAPCENQLRYYLLRCSSALPFRQNSLYSPFRQTHQRHCLFVISVGSLFMDTCDIERGCDIGKAHCIGTA